MKKRQAVTAPVPEPEIFTDEGKQVRVAVESERDFFARVRKEAAQVKSGAPKAARVNLSFESADQLLEVLSPKRYELFKSVRDGGTFSSIEELAVVVNRDRSTVSKDVRELAGIGLVIVETVLHPGHGRRSSISAVADDVHVEFSL